MNRTVLDWYLSLPDDICIKAFKALKQQDKLHLLHTEFVNVYSAIDLISWNKTDEGYNYWRSVAREEFKQ